MLDLPTWITIIIVVSQYTHKYIYIFWDNFKSEIYLALQVQNLIIITTSDCQPFIFLRKIDNWLHITNKTQK